MEKWIGKTVLITGTAIGIGKQMAEDLSKAGLIVLAIDYTDDRIGMIETNAKILNESVKGQLIPVKCDVRNVEDVQKTFALAEELYGGVDILINNAAFGAEGLFTESNMEDMQQTVDTNLTGVLYCTKEAIKSMKKKSSLCYIIMMNSISGHYIPNFKKPILNAYSPTKFALTSFAEQIRREMAFLQLNIKVTNLSPGIVDTTIFKRKEGSPVGISYFANNPTLTVQDVSDTIFYLLSTPPHLQVHELLVHALHEPL